MTHDEQQYLLQHLMQILQDNIGQRLTLALANGVLGQFEAATSPLTADAQPASQPQGEH